ncbi:hypothetical protein O6H91_04G094100 [Diphasiastrum complanatum]|uniref:Uncharacterized protein n=1 Tax=Diphasiastrum complanatum TaxID=34168 RepID=A0ACC2DZM3_DIPCM|nr:hypothetical protein O6H91_04G094100 [Diphasiastrum complanatum]
MIENCLMLINDKKSRISASYEITDLGQATKCLGLQIKRDRTRRLMHPNQSEYAEKVLKQCRMIDCTPMIAGARLSKQDCPSTKERQQMEKIPYQNLISSLMYLTICTRLDLAFFVYSLSQFSSNLGMTHWLMAKRILQYLKGTQNKGLTYKAEKELKLQHYSDASWASCKDDSKSVTSGCSIACGAAINWICKKQTLVAQFSCEVEYVAASKVVNEVIWLQMMLEAIGIRHREPCTMMMDSQRAIYLAQDPVFHSKTKHIPLKYHHIRDLISKGELSVKFIRSNKMIANLLTKPLDKPLFTKHSKSMGIG